MKSKDAGYKVGVVGATGAVGGVLLSQLRRREFPVSELALFASPRSVGKTIAWGGREWSCRALEPSCFDALDFVFFDASDAVSREWAPRAAEAGAWVIDNSGAFRMEEDIDLVVPEVNGTELERRLRTGDGVTPRSRIVAGPNCSTAQLVMALKPLHDAFGIKRVIVSSYQSSSGAGTLAMDELQTHTRARLDGRAAPKARAFQHSLAWNCIPQIGGFNAQGVTSEETKIQDEARKILGLPALKIAATAVRVPTLACHAETVNIEFERACDLASARRVLSEFPGVILQDEPARSHYPMGLVAQGQDAVFVGRLRHDPSLDDPQKGLNLWIVSDNLVKGAALNAIQIAETLLRALN